MKSFTVLVLVLLSLQSFAAKEVGNGGDVVVCSAFGNDGEKSKTYELLDYYEARVMRGIEINLNPYLANNERALVTQVLQRFEKHNPLREKFYLKALEEFYQSQQMLTGVALEDVKDSYHVFLPAGCYIQQAIIQRDPEFSEDKRYLIDGDLWKNLDMVTKAGLILHEVIYREAILAEHENSKYTRYLHSYLAADKFKTMSLEGYVTLLNAAKFPDFEYKGLPMLLCKPSVPATEHEEIKKCGERVGFNFWDSETLTYGYVAPHWAPWSKINEAPTINWRGQKLVVVGPISWYFPTEGGHLNTVYGHNAIDDQFNAFFQFESPIGSVPECAYMWNCTKTHSGEDIEIQFDQQGNIDRYLPANNPQFAVGDLTVKCQRGKPIRMEHGLLESCDLSDLQHFATEDFEVWARGEISFYDDKVNGLSGIESGYVNIRQPNGNDSKVSISEFNYYEDALSFRTSLRWIGDLMGQEILFNPGKFVVHAKTGKVAFFESDQPVDMDLRWISPIKIKATSITLGESDESDLSLIQELIFKGEAVFYNQAGKPTVYVGPGMASFEWVGNRGYIVNCRVTKSDGSTEACRTYNYTEGEEINQ